MEDKILQIITWLGNLLIFALLLYIGKSAIGINLNLDCHAEEVLLDNCKPERDENLINDISIINKF